MYVYSNYSTDKHEMLKYDIEPYFSQSYINQKIYLVLP
jgi:hypothetical protein